MRKRKKKALLNEGTIRRFMTLANMEPLQETYFDRYGLEEQEEEEGEEEVDMDLDVEMGAEGADEDIEAEEDVETDMDMAAEGGDVDEAAVEDLMTTIADAIEDKYGIPMSVEGGEEEVEVGDEELEVGGDEELEVGAEEEEVGGEEELMELLGDAGIEVVDDQALVREVMKRVAKRLIKQKMGIKR